MRRLGSDVDRRAGREHVVEAYGSRVRPARPAAESRFIAGVDVLCRRLNQALDRDRAGQRSGTAVAVTVRHAALERGTAERLRKLVPPMQLAGDWKRMNVYRQTLADGLLALVRVSQRHDATGRRTVSAAKARAHQGLFNLAVRDGFRDCARVGTSFKVRAASPSPGTQGPTIGIGGL
jgi:hypothetical protein